MARFNDAYLTDAGADLIAQSITDGVKIDFVRMEIGDGEYTEEEKSKDVLRKRTGLKNKRQESSFNSVEKAKDSAVKLKAAIDNRNVTNGYRMTEIGIFAKASGDTASDGVLYSIAVAVEADYMPPESTPITYIQEFYTKVGNAENVEITVSTGVYALAEDLAEVEEPTYTESEELEELTPGENLKLALGKLAKAVKEIITHMALKATGSVAGHVKVSSSAAVTDSTGMALAATEKNASLEGTLAYKLEQLNTNLMWKFFRNITGLDTDFTDLPTDFTELSLHIIWAGEINARNALHIPILHKELQTAVTQIRTGYYANSTANAMINMYVSLTKIKVAQAYVNGSSVVDNIVVGIYYR